MRRWLKRLFGRWHGHTQWNSTRWLMHHHFYLRPHDHPQFDDFFGPRDKPPA